MSDSPWSATATCGVWPPSTTSTWTKLWPIWSQWSSRSVGLDLLLSSPLSGLLLPAFQAEPVTRTEVDERLVLVAARTVLHRCLAAAIQQRQQKCPPDPVTTF